MRDYNLFVLVLGGLMTLQLVSWNEHSGWYSSFRGWRWEYWLFYGALFGQIVVLFVWWVWNDVQEE